MFYLQCPRCGGKVESAEPNDVKRASNQFGFALMQQARGGHHHPYLSLARTVFNAAHEIYKRVPGGGAKRCKGCGHEFR